MAFVEWDESFTVNIAVIDDQHKMLFTIISDFYDTLGKNQQEAMARVLNSLTGYAFFHFRTEEKYFDEFNYPEKEQHKKEHQVFVDKISELRTRLASWKLVLSMEITNFLRNLIF